MSVVKTSWLGRGRDAGDIASLGFGLGHYQFIILGVSVIQGVELPCPVISKHIPIGQICGWRFAVCPAVLKVIIDEQPHIVSNFCPCFQLSFPLSSIAGRRQRGLCVLNVRTCLGFSPLLGSTVSCKQSEEGCLQVHLCSSSSSSLFLLNR